MKNATEQFKEQLNYYLNSNDDLINYFRYDFIDGGNIQLIRPDQVESMQLKHGSELADCNEIIVANVNDQTGHPLNYPELNGLTGYLDDYLCHYVSIKFRIIWLLNNHNISNYSIAKHTGIKQPVLSYLKQGKRKIGNLSLNTAITLNNYYKHLLYEDLNG